MGLFDFVKKGAQELFIARPDDAKDLIVYKWPDPTIPMKAQLTVAEDEIAVFYKDGKFVDKVEPGRHTLETSNIPFLSLLIDNFTGGNVLKAEVWFITTREIGGKLFGGPIGDVEDPKSGVPVGLRTRGSYSLKVEDPKKVLDFFGLRSWSTDDEFEGWFKDQVKKTFRDKIAEMLVKQHMPLLDVTSGAYTEEIETTVVEAVKPHLVDYGMRMVRMGDLVIDMKEEDEVKLKSFYTDAAQLRMMGGNVQNYQAFAAGKAMLGAGEGMAKGGGGGDGGNPMLGGAGMGVGLGMAQMFNQQQQQQHGQVGMQQAPSVPQGQVGQVSCPKCGAKVAPGKFCAECGATLADKKQFCSECGKPLAAGAKFCAECGAKQP